MFEEALSGGTIYKKFCPMAFNNDGAYWYADVEEIKNPYFGDKMLKCGSVKKTIEKSVRHWSFQVYCINTNKPQNILL